VMGKIRQIITVLGIFVVTSAGRSLENEYSQQSPIKGQGNQPYQYFTSWKQQWKCIEKHCEEVITRCNNGVCGTSNQRFESDNFQPNLPEIEKPPGYENLDLKYLSTVRQQWKCIGNKCEENITKCNNGICDTKTHRFEAENYHPEVPNSIEKPAGEVPNFNLSEIVAITEPPPMIDVSSPFDNSGSIYSVTNKDNATYFFSNSKHINKKCQNKVCTIMTKTCVNGRCEEKITSQPFLF